MGANASDMQCANASSQQSSHILSFHSTAEWNAHFDASRETNKLVSLVATYVINLQLFSDEHYKVVLSFCTHKI